MFDQLVVNASPLIFLARVGGIDWLARLATPPLLVPRAVIEEIQAGADGEGVVKALEGDPRFEVVEDLSVPMLIGAWDLGRGESQVLALGQASPGYAVVLDDLAARSCARNMGVAVIGTLGVVLAARRRGWIQKARPVIESLVRQGMFLSRNLMEEALREVGE